MRGDATARAKENRIASNGIQRMFPDRRCRSETGHLSWFQLSHPMQSGLSEKLNVHNDTEAQRYRNLDGPTIPEIHYYLACAGFTTFRGYCGFPYGWGPCARIRQHDIRQPQLNWENSANISETPSFPSALPRMTDPGHLAATAWWLESIAKRLPTGC